jgi:hypothetical protein
MERSTAQDRGADQAGATPRRLEWVQPTLTAHASLAALTLQQYPEGAPGDSLPGSPLAVPCSQGFCP